MQAGNRWSGLRGHCECWGGIVHIGSCSACDDTPRVASRDVSLVRGDLVGKRAL